MKTRSEFAAAIAPLDLSAEERAVALLWFYRESQEFEERTASELAADLNDEGFPRSNTTRLHSQLMASKYTVRGTRARSFQVSLKRLGELQGKYGQLASVNVVTVEDVILPSAWFLGTRPFFEQVTRQINGAYQYRFYDACAVLCRRLMESLIIEIYIALRRAPEIRPGSGFLMLDALIRKIKADSAIVLSRGAPSTMDEVKSLGDTAAHDRNYITEPIDLSDDFRLRYRRLIRELMGLASIAPSQQVSQAPDAPQP
ncbi:MAG: hypothetical protein SXG53_21385 [Pseudomonadota bacterium]|nr:hypothetical protein [Pseudomonadota bacterium]